MAAETTAASAPAPLAIKPRHVAAAVVGNWLEFYDFTVYAYFSKQIGHAFFPDKSEFVELMAALVTYGAGFLARPIGAVVIGRFSDRAGRKPAMLLSFAMMGVALVCLVFVPSYAQIGIAAPILVLLFRLAQGFALGGEVGPTTAFLVEAAPAAKRGLYGAWQSASQSLSSLTGGLVGVVLAGMLSGPQFGDLGWRLAFGVGALVLPFGLIIRGTLPETMHTAEQRLEAHPEKADFRGHLRIIILGLGLITGGTVSTYVFSFMTTYAQETLHLGVGISFGITVATGAAGFFASLAGGALSDRVGRKPLLIWPRLIFLVAIIPVFMAVIHFKTAPVLLGLLGMLNFFANLSGVPALVAVTESLRKEVRGVGVATIYATAVSIFGGTTQFIVAWLDEVTHNPLAIAWYLVAATLVALVASVLMVETAGPRAALKT